MSFQYEYLDDESRYFPVRVDSHPVDARSALFDQKGDLTIRVAQNVDTKKLACPLIQNQSSHRFDP